MGITLLVLGSALFVWMCVHLMRRVLALELALSIERVKVGRWRSTTLTRIKRTQQAIDASLLNEQYKTGLRDGLQDAVTLADEIGMRRTTEMDATERDIRIEGATVLAQREERAEAALREAIDRITAYVARLEGIIGEYGMVALGIDVQTPSLPSVAQFQEDQRATRAEIAAAMAVLQPSMPESGLVDACKQVKQAEIAWRSNCDTQDEIIDKLRMQLTACSVAAAANTEETAAQRLSSDHPYYSAAYIDVCGAVDREMEHRKRLRTWAAAFITLFKENGEGPWHDEGCPEDDTCDCSMKHVNDAVNDAARMLGL